MINVTGMIKEKEEKGSVVLTINDIPISKQFQNWNGRSISLKIVLHRLGDKVVIHEQKGHAEVYFFEGKQLFFSGTKYVNDFFIEEVDIIEELEKFKNELVTISIEIVE